MSFLQEVHRMPWLCRLFQSQSSESRDYLARRSSMGARVKFNSTAGTVQFHIDSIVMAAKENVCLQLSLGGRAKRSASRID